MATRKYPMISYQEALALISQVKITPHSERKELSLAMGRKLAKPISCPMDLPPFSNSAMDGYAFRMNDYKESGLKLLGSAYAERSSEQNTIYEPGGCLKIMTGAPVPDWADTVIPIEKTRTTGAQIEFCELPEKGSHIRQRGEDLARGDLLLEPGTLLTPEKLALIAQCGISHVDVNEAVKMHIICTGNELKSPGSQLEPGEVYNSSLTFLESVVRSCPGIELSETSVISDDIDSASLHFSKISQLGGLRLILTTGAVSAGERDFVPSLAADLGFHQLFHKVKVRPGKPVFLAQRDSCLWLGLAGNPISTQTGWHFFAKPLLSQIAGFPFPRREKMTMMRTITKPERLTCFYRATTTDNRVDPSPFQGSGNMRASIDADSYAILPDSTSIISAGSEIYVQRI